MNNGAQRVLVILKEIAKSPDGVGVRELARCLGQSPSGVQKGLQALLAQDFVRQDGESKRYLLGPAAFQVGLAGLAHLDVRTVAREPLDALAKDSGETAFLAIRHGDEALYVEKVLGAAEIRMDVPIGARRPLNSTAVGKILLAFMPDQEFYRLAGAGAFVRTTPNTSTDPMALRAEILQIRESGVAFDREEFAIGSACIAAPVRNCEGNVVAAVTISGPARRVDATEANIELVKSCARRISHALGYQG
jgi:IclR family acetate operon transcriptional repressor